MTDKKLNTKEEIEDEINSLMRKRDRMIIDADKLQKEMENLTDRYLEFDSNHVKIKCLTCGGVGYIVDEIGGSNKKKVCSNPTLPFLSCRGRGYIWLEKYKGNSEK